MEQPSRIINVNESCISPNGGNRYRGGRPEAVFYCPSLPQTGRATGNSRLTTTLITGSTAAGEEIPPHFQFLTKTQTVETDKLRVELVVYMPYVRGKCGTTKEQAWPIINGMNAKGVMDDVEFN